MYNFMLHSLQSDPHESTRSRWRRAGVQRRQSADRFERETIAILKRLSRRPIEPAADSELLGDLGFDSLQVLELVGELEDHFNIAVPLNSLTHIRTVGADRRRGPAAGSLAEGARRDAPQTDPGRARRSRGDAARHDRHRARRPIALDLPTRSCWPRPAHRRRARAQRARSRATASPWSCPKSATSSAAFFGIAAAGLVPVPLVPAGAGRRHADLRAADAALLDASRASRRRDTADVAPLLDLDAECSGRARARS